MMKSNHPFIIDLYFTFQDDKYLYYGMEFIEGGILLDYITKVKFTEKMAQFYAA